MTSTPRVDRFREAQNWMRADYRRKSGLQANFLTGRCSDGLHLGCAGSMLSIPCCCACHTIPEENTDVRA